MFETKNLFLRYIQKPPEEKQWKSEIREGAEIRFRNYADDLIPLFLLPVRGS